MSRIIWTNRHKGLGKASSVSVPPPLGGTRWASLQKSVGRKTKGNLALKLAGVVGLWGRSCLCWRAREPRELPPFVSLALLARADVPGAGGISVECHVILRVLPSTNAPKFRIATRVLCMASQLK